MIAHGWRWIRAAGAYGDGASVRKKQCSGAWSGGEHGGDRRGERRSGLAGASTLAWASIDGQCKWVSSTQHWVGTAPMGRIVEVGWPGKLVFKFSNSNQADPNCKIWKGYFHSSKNFRTLKGDR
jgi:hypothetical protein